jgi:hypothetical protein
MQLPQDLDELVRAQAEQMEAWQLAEAHLLAQELRRRLAAAGIDASADVARALMAMANLLAPHTPEWGGDCRDTLGEVALIGLALLDAPS